MDLNQIIQDAIIEPNKDQKNKKLEFIAIKSDLQGILDKYLTKKVENLTELQDIQKVFELSFLDSKYIFNKEKIVDLVNFLDKLIIEYSQYNIELPFDTKDLKDKCCRSLDIQEIEKEIDVFEVRIALLRDKYEILKNRLENICNKVINISELKEYFFNDEQYVEKLIDITKLHDNIKFIYECRNSNSYSREYVNTMSNNNDYTPIYSNSNIYNREYVNTMSNNNDYTPIYSNSNIYNREYVNTMSNNNDYTPIYSNSNIINVNASTISNNEYFHANFNENKAYLQNNVLNTECTNLLFKEIKNITFIKKYISRLKNNQFFKNIVRKYEILNSLQNINDFDMKVILLELINNKEIRIDELVNKYQLDKIEIIKKIYILDYKKIVVKDENNNVIKLNVSF